MRKGLHYLATAAMLLGMAAPALAVSEPVVGTVSPTTATTNTATTISASYSDPDGVTSCTLFVDGTSQGTMTLSGGSGSTSGTASKSHTFTANGSYNLQVRCLDAHGNAGLSPMTHLTAGPASPPAPTVGAITPVTATVNTATTFSATYSDTDTVTGCQLYINGSLQGSMSLSGSTSGTATLSHTFSTGGSYELQARCTDAAGNTGHGASTTVVVSPTSPPAPSVGSITPTSATAGVATTLSATYSDTDTVSSCTLYVNGTASGSMSLTGSTSGTATISHTFSASGNYQVQARCTDASANVGLGATTTLTAFAQSSPPAPSVGGVTPTSAGLNVATTLSASYSDTDAVTSCTLWVDGTNQGSMSLTGSTSGTASKAFTFTGAGTHTAQVTCTDAAGNVGSGALTTLSIPGSSDTQAPSAPTSLLHTTSATDSTPTFTWAASTDNTGVTAYEVSVDGGAYASVGNQTSTTLGTLANGTHTLAVRARDAAGNFSTAAMLTFSINAPAVPPTLPPGLSSATTFTLEIMDGDATFVFSNATRAEYEARLGRGCELASSTAMAKLTAVLGNVTNATARAQIENFLACGTASTWHLGAGERLGTVNSFRAAFGRLPESKADWFDIIKIGNGRFPTAVSATAEANARAAFQLIYLRPANTSITADNNAIVVIAYGLRPLPRNLSSEAAAIVTFRSVHNRLPSSATDWDIVRAVAYSGATR